MREVKGQRFRVDRLGEREEKARRRRDAFELNSLLEDCGEEGRENGQQKTVRDENRRD